MAVNRRKQKKQKRRERELRAQRERRLEGQRCEELLFKAQIAWEAKAWDQSRRALEKILRLRPGHPEAREHLARLSFLGRRWEQGLAHYEQLIDPPFDVSLVYHAAHACWVTAQYERCVSLAREFVRESRHIEPLEPLRAAARQLATAAKKNARALAARGRLEERRDLAQPSLFSSSRSARSAPAESGQIASPATADRAGSDNATARPSDVSAEPRSSPRPEMALPAFPTVTLPDITCAVEFIGAEWISEARTAPLRQAMLHRDYATLRLQKGFDELLSLPQVHGVEHFWYQLETVRRVLRDFRGRALLADEVGLGKTIEACLALKEYWMRGLVRKALILTPPSLVGQWVEELGGKFGLSAVTPADASYARDPDAFWSQQNLVVASLALARQPTTRARLTREPYDLVIVDEAHALKSRATAAWQIVSDLKKRFLLLLSATPVGNNLAELYNLVLLLQPGLLRSEAEFKREYGRAGALEEPARREKLRALLREVMVRNTRAHIDLRLPRRFAATRVIPPSPRERLAQEAVAEFVRERYVQADPANRLSVMTLQMEAGSSASALRRGLRRRAAQDSSATIQAALDALDGLEQPAKTVALVDLLRRSADKAIVFSRFVATLDEVRDVLDAAGIHAVSYHGGLSAPQKDRAIAEFAGPAQILLATEVGSEGRNLQFCRTVINYDLPWNPMAIEQRVGRVHRIGQARDVYVFNFCLAGSIEEQILRVLHEKINLFELVAGEMEMVLGHLDEEQDFASLVMDLWAGPTTDAERQRGFDELGERLLRAKSRYDQTQALDRALFREDYEV